MLSEVVKLGISMLTVCRISPKEAFVFAELRAFFLAVAVVTTSSNSVSPCDASSQAAIVSCDLRSCSSCRNRVFLTKRARVPATNLQKPESRCANFRNSLPSTCSRVSINHGDCFSPHSILTTRFITTGAAILRAHGLVSARLNLTHTIHISRTHQCCSIVK